MARAQPGRGRTAPRGVRELSERLGLYHHTIPHSTEESMLYAVSCSTSKKILPFLSPGHQVNWAKLIHPSAIWLSRHSPILNGSNWLSLNLCFLISGRCVTLIWQFSSTSTSTFSNSSISYLKSEYKNLRTGTVPRFSQTDMMKNLHIDPEDVFVFFLIILALVPEQA